MLHALGPAVHVAVRRGSVRVTQGAAGSADPSTERVVGELRSLYDEIAACRSLSPEPQVNALFRRLVRLVVDSPPGRAAAVMSHPGVRAIEAPLRTLCSQAEYELELAWARRIAASTAPHDELGRFPYVGNYRDLSRMERVALAEVDGVWARPLGRVAFVGSGPLPLTSFLLAAELGVGVANLDRDAAAIEASERVASALGVTGVTFRHLEVGRGTDLSAYDLVILAALVGPTPADKQRMLAQLAASMAPGALLLARSARGLRTLLYPPIVLDALEAFELLGVVHPTHEVINSVILARRR